MPAPRSELGLNASTSAAGEPEDQPADLASAIEGFVKETASAALMDVARVLG